MRHRWKFIPILFVGLAFSGSSPGDDGSAAAQERRVAAGQLRVAGRRMRCGRTPTLVSRKFWDYGGATKGLIIINPQKMATILGDLFGLIDDNTYSEHVFKGIFSKQLLKYGSAALTFESTLGQINGVALENSHSDIRAYVGNQAFHIEVYGAPSALVTLVAIFTADLLVRPAGNFITIFGFREAGRKVNEFGLKIIENSVKVPFL